MGSEDMDVGSMDAGEMMSEDDEDFGVFQLNVEKNVTADGGVTKTVTKEGHGFEKPEAGDKVEVHYVGTLLDGTKFDSSRDRNDPFTFTLGQGEVIRGWDEGVKTMLKGEQATLKCLPEYAYGEAGSPPKIPANSTLLFEVELLSWKSVKDISGDGGIIKTTIKEGSGWDHPKDKDEVLVKYEAFVDGVDVPFAKSPDEGTEFVLEDGHLCKAVPIALRKMKEGEAATLIVKPEYGLGSEGKSPDVPENATLKIKLELVSWKKVEKVTDDGGVSKKMLVKGKGYDRPKETATVVVKYTGRLLDGTVFERTPEGEEQSIVIDEEQVVDGLDLALMKMVVEEVAEITIQPAYAFGETGAQKELAKVPSNATVVYTVELVSVNNPKSTWDMSNEEKIADAQMKKEKGNEAYKQGKLNKAIKRYEAAVKAIENDKDFGEAKSAAKDLKKATWLNLAAAYLKSSDHLKVIENCGKVLDIDSNNVKGLYRRSQAYLLRSDFIEAESDIKRARALEPNNKDLIAFFRKMKAQIKQASQEQAKLYSNMFSKLAKQDLYKDVPVPLEGAKENLDPSQDEAQPKEIATSSEEPAPQEAAKSSSS